MSAFTDLLHANGEYLLKAYYRAASKQSFKLFGRAQVFAASLGLNEEQFVCGLGFNRGAADYTDIILTLGYADFAAVKARRDEVFSTDVYERLSLDNVVAIYLAAKSDSGLMQELQPLMLARIRTIESALETYIRPRQMQYHRAEMDSIYRDGIAAIEFAEARLAMPDNGFRSMLNEVQLIANARLIPPGDMFFRSSVLPQEKRRMIEQGMVPRNLISARLQDLSIDPEERRVLESCLSSSPDATFD
jgi:hypothetical protein